jgi:transcriptional regulator with XRE-family HTH domain
MSLTSGGICARLKAGTGWKRVLRIAMRYDSGVAGSSSYGALVPVTSGSSISTNDSYRASGRDEWIAYEFGRMRADLRLTVPALARRIGTDVSVINNFENGATDQLPQWQETVRIVEGYAMMLGTDPSRILSRLLLSQPVAPGRSDPTHRVGALPIPALPDTAAYHGPYGEQGNATTRRSRSRAEDTDGEQDDDRRSRRRRRTRRLMALSFPVALIAGLGWWAQTSPRAMYNLANAMPSALQTPMLASANFLMMRVAPSRDGLRWIDVDDPRVRKGDKLRQANR